jgi:hypothetical protein
MRLVGGNVAESKTEAKSLVRHLKRFQMAVFANPVGKPCMHRFAVF